MTEKAARWTVRQLGQMVDREKDRGTERGTGRETVESGGRETDTEKDIANERGVDRAAPSARA